MVVRALGAGVTLHIYRPWPGRQSVPAGGCRQIQLSWAVPVAEPPATVAELAGPGVAEVAVAEPVFRKLYLIISISSGN